MLGACEYAGGNGVKRRTLAGADSRTLREGGAAQGTHRDTKCEVVAVAVEADLQAMHSLASGER